MYNKYTIMINLLSIKPYTYIIRLKCYILESNQNQIYYQNDKLQNHTTIHSI